MKLESIVLSGLAVAILGVLGITAQRLGKIEETIHRLDSKVEELNSVVLTGQTVKYTQREADCLARNVYYEAGVENAIGRYAVAHVTLNRLKQGKWGNDICKVVYSPKQFSWTLKKKLPKPNPAVWRECMTIATNTLNGTRVSGLDRSLFYHADYIATPKWADQQKSVTQIGRHIFYNRAKNSSISI